MTPVFIADTHALVWFLAGSSRLSATAFRAIEDARRQNGLIGISAITLVEMVYLEERQRIPSTVLSILSKRLKAPDCPFLLIPVDERIALAVRSIDKSQVPELPDRIIAATALAFGVPLITKDSEIQASGLRTVW